MALNLKKGQIITILDVLLIAFVMFFAKSYLNKYNKNSTSVTKDGVKYTLVINNQKIVKDELMNIRFKIENKKKDKKILEIKTIIFLSVVAILMTFAFLKIGNIYADKYFFNVLKYIFRKKIFIFER